MVDPNLNDFPDYLVFGTLDKESVKVRKDKISAEYRDRGNVVYRVNWGKDGCQLESLFEGKKILTAYGLDLKEAFVQYMASIITNPNKDPHFTRIVHKAISGKNVHFEVPTGEILAVYPAGFIFVLRQPIVESNREAWENFRCKFDSDNELPPLKLKDERPGTILRLSEEGNVSIEEIDLVDFSCVLRSLVEAVQVIWESGIIPPQKEYRLAVVDASHSMTGTVSVHRGDSKQGVSTFVVLPVDRGSPDLKESIDIFTERSRVLLT